jgi:hypothetical protein
MTQTPHDALFKAVFSRPERAAEELRHALGPELARAIDFTTLQLVPGSVVDETLHERHTDLLFSVRCGAATIRVLVLFEHQSGVDPWMPLRLLGYMLRIWEAIVKTQPDARRLPALVPVVLHHGETGWRAATSFEALIEAPPDAPGSLEFVPRFRFALDDLTQASEAAIVARVGSAYVRLVLAALRSARGPQELARLLRGWVGLMGEVSREPDGAVRCAWWSAIFPSSARARSSRRSTRRRSSCRRTRRRRCRRSQTSWKNVGCRRGSPGACRRGSSRAC